MHSEINGSSWKYYDEVYNRPHPSGLLCPRPPLYLQ